jgi:hypothetical protein
MEVVDRISVSPTGAAGPFKQEAPIQQVVIQKVELLSDSGAPAPPPATTAPPPAETPAATPPAETPPTDAGTQTPADKPATPPAETPPPK